MFRVPFETLHHRYRALRLRLAEFQRAARNHETWLIGCAILLGAGVGLITYGLRELVTFLHALDFGLAPGEFLSAQLTLHPLRLALVPALGGLVLGLVTLAWQRWRPVEIVDPVEANALYGGQMSLRDSLRLTGLTLISNASGASVGMEAGYSQLGSGLFSVVGAKYQLRREDQRLMVTAGAAAAIAAAFNAPLAGAFYGFELVHGSYSTRGLAPVTGAALAGAMVIRLLGSDAPLFSVAEFFVIPNGFYLLFAALGLLAAGLGILTMQSATWVERALRAVHIPQWLRPAVGGGLLSLIALWSPQVLGAGHGAIEWHLNQPLPLVMILALLVAKLAASAVSLGAGFRGGLFSSSLFLGALLGAAFVDATAHVLPVIFAQRHVFMLVGMGAVGAAIIGAPFTMIFLVLEATGDFPVTMGVAIGVIVASTVVRLTFGYSFSTWRFHLRGLRLRGGQDIGWIATLRAGRLMRADAKVVDQRLSLAALRRRAPIGAAKYLFVTDETGAYTGLIDVVALHDPDLGDLADLAVAADLAHAPQAYLLPEADIAEILKTFSDRQSEVLPVLDAPASRKVVGYLTEAYCLKRYAQELERRRSDELGMPG